MRSSNYTIATLKETPADAEITSHRLMIRGGFIRKLASGLYNWMPLGLRVLQKVEKIIREEMNRSGAQEVLMPVVQPADLWRESGRWDKYEEGDLLKFADRHGREFCFGPTHEEVITDLARNLLRSHKQLPVNYYQVQTKFRDETRPRFGLLRAREFLMKDAYSFHIDQTSLEKTFGEMHQTYCRILERIDLDFRPVLADTGSIGGSASVEFQVLADSGEDTIVYSSESDYAANIELAESLAPQKQAQQPLPIEKISTPDVKTIEEVANFLCIKPAQSLKTLIVKGSKAPLVALVLRGDHQLNPLKAEKFPQISVPLTMATEEEIKRVTDCSPGSIGPVSLDLMILADRDAAVMNNFVCGANKDDFHLKNVNWQRDAEFDEVYDLRNVEEGDLSPDGKGFLKFRRGIEVGHIFQLGDTYSRKMNATVLDDNGNAIVMTMGCYGMGVSRLVAAIIEQNHDEHGIIWPSVVAPFQVTIIPINAHKSEQVAKISESLYLELSNRGLEILLDDREGIRPGAKFADADLIGIPHRIVIGDRGLEQNNVEYTERSNRESIDIKLDQIVDHIFNKLAPVI